jgi:hypothetical protein
MKTGKSLFHKHNHPSPPQNTCHGTGGQSVCGHTHNISVQNHPSYNYSMSGSSSTFGYLYNANIVISVNYDGSVNIIKNRHGIHGENQSLDTTIDVIANILTTTIFKGSLDMFQEGLKIKLVESIIKTIKEERGDLFENSI